MAEGFGGRLRLVRQHLGLSAADMAERFGVNDRRTWERYERHETRPNTELLTKLHAQGFDVAWLLSGEGTMLRLAPVPAPVTIADYSQVDRLYEIAIAATLRWYEAARLVGSPEGVAGVVSRAVRQMRASPAVTEFDEAALSAEVARILDLAHDMLRAGGWTPRRD